MSVRFVTVVLSVVALAACGNAPAAGPRGTIRVVHAIECCYVEGAFTGVRIENEAGDQLLRRERQGLALAGELATEAVRPGRYRVETWERPCSGSCDQLDAPTDRCTIDVTVAADATTDVRVRVAPGLGCVADAPGSPVASDGPPRAGAPWWPTTLVEIDAASGAIVAETPISLPWPKLIGTDGSRPMYETESGGARSVDGISSAPVFAAAAATGVVAILKQSTGRLVVADSNGHRRWAQPITWAGYPPAIGTRSVVAIDDSGAVRAFDAAAGASRWTTRVRSSSPFQRTTP